VSVSPRGGWVGFERFCGVVRLTPAASLPAHAGNPVHLGDLVTREKRFWVYILASRIGGTLYIGVTSNLVGRVYLHRTNAVPSFTQKYGVHRLVYFEEFSDAENAIRREKRLKKWPRAWKIRLIEEKNPNWDDLYPAIASP
jgi:putative endonuclease